jgi:hypothetical protein
MVAPPNGMNKLTKRSIKVRTNEFGVRPDGYQWNVFFPRVYEHQMNVTGPRVGSGEAFNDEKTTRRGREGPILDFAGDSN